MMCDFSLPSINLNSIHTYTYSYTYTLNTVIKEGENTPHSVKYRCPLSICKNKQTVNMVHANGGSGVNITPHDNI